VGAVRLRGKLLGYLDQQEDSRGTGIRGQQFVALDNERRYCGSEKTSLF